MITKTLQEQYEHIATKYVHTFLRKQRLYDEYTGEYYEYDWVADQVGTILWVSDYFISFENIRYDIDNDIPPLQILEHNDYCIQHDSKINYKSYLKGIRENPTHNTH